MIWDLHCHLSGVDGRTPDERIAQLMEIADRMGVDRLVFSMGWPWSQDPEPDDFRKQNDQVIQALGHWQHRAVGLAYLNPKHGEESLEELDRVVRDGPLVGVKLWVAERCSAESLDAMIEKAAGLKALIFQHTWYKTGGNYPGESTPDDLALLAKRHPDVPLICGHSGGNWERGIRAIRDCPNVYVETAGFDPTAGMVELAVRELGDERVLYGSDIGGRSFASQLAKVIGAEITEPARRRILGENLRNLLKPILTAKGMRL